MISKENNYAFIDRQNLNLGIKVLGWKLDLKKFRVYIKEKYGVSKAYYFVGFVAGNQKLYDALQEYGYILNFKPIVLDGDRKPKGNVDANLVLKAMADFHENNFDKAVIITSDGDFYCLLDYLNERGKLRMVISPYFKTCSSLLRKSAKDKLTFLDNLKEKLEYKRKSTA